MKVRNKFKYILKNLNKVNLINNFLSYRKAIYNLL